jgi:hypothetical protein
VIGATAGARAIDYGRAAAASRGRNLEMSTGERASLDRREGGAENEPRAEGSARTVWRLSVPGVCRLIDDPERLALVLRSRPDASVVRLRRGRLV